MHAHALHIELSRVFEHRVGNLLIVHPPAMVKALRARSCITFPGIDLQLLGLHGHEIQIRSPQLGRRESVGQHALGSCQPVDLVSDVGHLLRRHDRFLGIRSRRRTNEADRRFTVEKHFFDEVLPREIIERPAVGREPGIRVPSLARGGAIPITHPSSPLPDGGLRHPPDHTRR